MMRVASRYHLARAGRIVLAVAALGVAALFVRGKMDEDRHRAQAHGLVRRLLDADTMQVPSVVAELAGYRRWADPELRRAVADRATRPAPRRHARIALLPVDASQAPALFAAMLEADPDEFLIVCDALRPFRTDLVVPLWQAAESTDRPAGQSFRAAVALASYDPESERWAGRAGPVVRQLAAQPSLLVPAWVEMLRPVGGRLVPALADRLRDRAEDEPLVASILAGYAADRHQLLAELVGDAGRAEFAVLLASKWTEGPRAARQWMRPSHGSSRRTGPMRRT